MPNDESKIKCHCGSPATIGRYCQTHFDDETMGMDSDDLAAAVETYDKIAKKKPRQARLYAPRVCQAGGR